MTATAEPPVASVEVSPSGEALTRPPLNRAEGVELLGDIHGCGYRDGACLVRRSDGQMVQLGRLMYALLESTDGRRETAELAAAVSERLGRRVEEDHVVRLAQKLARQGLLAGTEHHAPPRRNPLLALRWKVLVTNPVVTSRITAPFTFLFRPWLMWPILACFVAVFWFVLFHKGVAGATADAFRSPGLLLLVFVLAVVSAGFHELGHAAAARYSGATPGGMGVGLYLVWPAFYTDVTDAYRLPRRDRLRVDLAGLYFNAVVAVITMAVWLAVRSDALLLLVALQVLQMVKQLSPVIRADGYHILSDATGVPDLYAHLGSTLRRLLPGRQQEPSALTARARFLVTAWVLIVLPVLLALMLGAVLLMPRLATTAWDSGHHIIQMLPHQVDHGQVLEVLASLLGLLALVLPVAGSVLVTQKIVRTTAGKARDWSRGRPARRALVLAAAGVALVGIAWAWWPSGQYQPIRASQGGTVPGLVRLVSAPAGVVRPGFPPSRVGLAPGTHLAVAMIPVGGASHQHPALFIFAGRDHQPAVAIVSYSSPRPPPAAATNPAATAAATGGSSPTVSTPGVGSATPTPAGGPSSSSSTTPSARSAPVPATTFPFKLPAAPGPGDTQALAIGSKNGSVTYDVAYALITVSDGAPVTNTNSAYALASCSACTTVAVSFQVVLIVGQSRVIVPINAAGALNYNCPACITTAVADQVVATLTAQPTAALLHQLNTDLRQLNALPALGANGTPTAVVTQVALVQQEIDSELAASGLLANPPNSQTNSTSTSSGSTTATSSGGTSSGSTTTAAPGSTTPSFSSTTQTATTPTTNATGSTTSTTPATTSTSPSGPSPGSGPSSTTTSTGPTG